MSLSFSVSNPLAVLQCNSGCCVQFGSGLNGDSDSYEYTVLSDWFAARIGASVEPQRVSAFKHDLGRLAAGKSKEASLINAHGNLELRLVAGARGNVSVIGTICKDMSKDEQVVYELQTDLSSVSSFYEMWARQQCS